MRHRVILSSIAILWALLVGSYAAPEASAQSAPQPRAVQNSATQLQVILDRGLELEKNRRWSEALSHYEGALSNFPEHPMLLRRMETAKIHYGIGKRYNDESFIKCLRTLTEDEAMELYNEILLKVQSHYVDEPHWQKVVDLGTQGTKVALIDENFKQRHLQDVPQEWVDNFRRDMRGRVEILGVRTRQDALEAVRLAGRLARRHLGVAPSSVILEYTYHAVQALDDYSTYLTPSQLTELFSQIDGNFVGLGIELRADQGSLLLVDVIDGSPAKDAGLRAGERIVAVDGRTTEGLSTGKAASMLQGPEGSTVEVTLQSPDGRQRRVRVQRRRIDVPSIEDVKMLDAQRGVAYLRLTSFQKTTPQELDKALWKLHRQGMRSLVMDLRGNPGGLLTTSVEVADRFIPSGRIVATRGRSPDQNWSYSAHKSGTWHVPLIVLIDHDSASAAEIFAGAIRDHRRGYLVGEKSYGKGSVQSIFTLNHANSGLRLTTAKFYSPLGKAYSKVGVTPHITVRSTAKPVTDGSAQKPPEDPVIREAVRVAREKY